MKPVLEILKSRQTVLIKGAVAGAAGAAALVAKRAFLKTNPLGPAIVFVMLNDTGNAVMSTNPHVASLCNRLAPYRIFDRVSHDNIILYFAELVSLNAETTQKNVSLKISTPRKASIATSKITEAIRMLRATFAARMQNSSKAMADFDDIAGGMQQACTDMTFNINMNFRFYQNK